MELGLKIAVATVAIALTVAVVALYLRNLWFLVLTIRAAQYASVHFVLRVIGVFFFPPLGVAMGAIPFVKEDKETDHHSV